MLLFVAIIGQSGSHRVAIGFFPMQFDSANSAGEMNAKSTIMATDLMVRFNNFLQI
jgi:hypothetical protein